jgi:altronate dehydratase small subunit
MSAPPTDSRLLLLAPEDDCLIAATRLEAGARVLIDGEPVALAQTVELGHKVARRPLANGDTVRRYGAPIGHVIRAVARGEHLHTHNLVSDYLPTYTHDAGHAFVER